MALVAAREARGAAASAPLSRAVATPSRLAREAVLDGHDGCVNHVSWSADGCRLLSGSDDTRLCVWDVARPRTPLVRLATGHSANIFCVRYLPTRDDVVATCAGDGEVRVHALERGDAPHVFASHTRRVKKLQVEPGNPNLLLSASEDGTVRQNDLRQPPAPPLPRRRDLRAEAAASLRAPDVLLAVHGGRVELNSISLAALRPELLAVGGSDVAVRVYDRRFVAAAGRGATPLALLAPAEQQASGAFASVTAVAFAANGAQLLGSYLHGPVHLLDVPGTARDAGGSAAAAVLPAGEHAAATSAAASARAWLDEELPLAAASQEDEEDEEDTPARAAAEAAAEAARAGALAEAAAFLTAALEVRGLRATRQQAAPPADSRAARVADSRLRLARAEAMLALAARAAVTPGADPPAERARGFALRALQDAAAAAELAPREGRAPFAEARALQLLGRAAEARERLAAAEALCWNAQLQRLRRELDAELAGDAAVADGDGDTMSEESEEVEAADVSVDAATRAACAAVLTLLREARAAERAPRAPPPGAPPPPPRGGYGAGADASCTLSGSACRYVGHRHAATIKDVAFLGDRQEYVASGSDDGRFFVWRRRDGALLAAPRADCQVVNCVQSAPGGGGGLHVASCGIDSSVKLWAPTADVDAAAAAAAEAAEAAAANDGAARRGADGGRRALPQAVTRTLLRLLRRAHAREHDEDDEDDDP